MAGLFCWMYVTKPVFVGPSRVAHPEAVGPAIRQLEAETGEWRPSTAGVGTSLDPARGGLPGESAAADTITIVNGDNAPEAEGFRPLKARPGGRGLFTPFAAPPAGGGAPEQKGEEASQAGVAAGVAAAGSAPDEPANADDHVPDGEPGRGADLAARAGSSGPPGDEAEAAPGGEPSFREEGRRRSDFRLSSSFMAEFSVDGGKVEFADGPGLGEETGMP